MDNKKTKVAFFLPSLDGGGAERNVVNILNNISSKYYEKRLVLAEKKGDFLEDLNSETLIFNLRTVSLIVIFFKLIAYFRKEKPDIFVSSFPRFNVVSLLAKIFSRVSTKIILTEHNFFSLFATTAKTLSHRLIARFLFPYVILSFYPRADAIICVSHGVAKDFLTINKKLKINVIYNPITHSNIQKLAQESVNHPWFLNKEIPVIVMVGRLLINKDYPTFFKAFHIILKQQPAHLVILGKGQELEKLQNLAKDLDITESIAFLGFQKNPYKYMRQATVFVLSSSREGFGNVIVEAMACGTPVISTNCFAGPNEIIKHGTSGMLIPVFDYEGLAKAVILILRDAPLRRKFSEEGLKRAQDFTIQKSVGNYEALFEKLILK